jgi:Rrf2 family protein
MTMLSQTAEYALRAVIQLALEPRGAPVQASEVATRLRLPANYLGKTLLALGRAGLVTGTRGKGGGYQLARPAGEITLAEVIAPFERLEGPSWCLLGRPECSDRNPCAAHERWKAATARATAFYHQTTINELLKSAPGAPGA